MWVNIYFQHTNSVFLKREGNFMKKKIVSVLVFLCMLTAILTPAMGVWAADGVWSGGTAVPSLVNGYYQIANAENLAWFATQVNSGSTTIKAQVTSDIYLNETGSTANAWTPIGSESMPFKGEFDGGGHTIYGLYVTGSNDYSGLFGYVYTQLPNIDGSDDSTTEITVPKASNQIYDLHVKDADVSGGQNVGGIVGYIHFGIISGCSFEGNVTGSLNSVGGVVGYAYEFSEVNQCYSKGSVTGAIRTGGVAGYINANSVVSECYSESTVVSNATVNGSSGGVVGTISASEIANCYFLGMVTGPKRIGGIIGNNSYSTVHGCYVIAPVTSTLSSPEYIGAVVGYSFGGTYYNCYYNQPSTFATDVYATAKTLEEMKQFGFVRELNENGNSYTFDYMVINNSYPVFAWSLETAVWAGGIKQPQTDSAGYYLISTADELAWFARLVNGTLANVEQNTSAKAKVTENILLNIFIVEGSEDTNVWTPIGSAESPFTGIFIGNYYNIAGVYTNGSTNQGLFGYVGEGGSVSEVLMIDGLITGGTNVGAVAGYNKGTVSYSCNAGTVEGTKALGGIVGYNAGAVKYSYNIGTVNCTSETGSQIGGICGYNTRATISECFNNGYVTGAAGANFFGGIVGHNSGDGIYNCYNSGEIYGGFYIGGLVGRNTSGTIKYCYNRGVVNTKNAVNSNINNFIGENVGTCTILNCYYDTTIEDSIMNNANGATGKSTDGLTGSNITTLLGFQSGVWSNRTDDTYFRYYPQLTEIYGGNSAKAKTDSLDSAKVVKSQYLLKVQIAGQAATYHESFESAMAAITTNAGIITPVRNFTLNSTVTVSGNVTLQGEGYPKTITRASSLTDVMFNVTGSLTLGDSKFGDDNDTLLEINGNGSSVTSEASVISVQKDATLTTYPGVKITNNNTSATGGAVYLASGSAASLNGGIIDSNTTSAEGGAIYNNAGTLNISAAKITNNTSSQKGGAIYNNGGTINVSGGEISSNYGKTLGGAVYNIGTDASVTISGGVLSENFSNAGGGIYVNSGTVTVSGGEIKNNFAYNKRSTSATMGGGGGITVATSGKLVMSGGSVKDNYVYNNVGDGFGMVIYGTFEMSGAAAVTNNDIYLAKNRTVCVTAALTASGTAATITPNTYSTETLVLSGNARGLSYKKFEITPNGTATWNVNSSGYLMNTDIVNVASLSKFGAYSVEYISIAQAAAQIGAGESGIITVIADNTISETIKIYGDVTILSETDQIFTSRRGGSFNGTIFEVEKGGTLRLGYTDTETQGETISSDSVGGEYHLDGGYTYSEAQGTAMINVKAGGTLYTYDDFILENSYSTSSGTVIVAGTAHIYGGTYQNNKAVNGGAFNVTSTGSLNLYGGTITGNSVIASGLGKAIYSAGTLTRAANVYEYYQNDELVASQGSFVTIDTNNDVYLTSTKKLNLQNTVSTVLLADSAEIPETTPVTAAKMILTAPSYYIGMPILEGTDVSIHYASFGISQQGYYIRPDGTIDVNLLVPSSSTGLKIDRQSETYKITGVNTDKNTAQYFEAAFINNDKIEVRAADGTVLTGTDKVGTGCTVNLYNSDGSEIIDTVYVLIYGDVDCDGKVDGMDSMYISCIVQGLLTQDNLSPLQIAAADIDASSSVAEADAQYVQMCGALIYKVDQSI